MLELEEQQLNLISDFLNQYKDQLEFIGEGRSRRVYRHKKTNYVIKIPLDNYGADDNYIEASASKSFYKDKDLDEYLPCARCRLFKGIFLVMEYVEYVKNPYSNEMPDWVGCVDCGQVGYTRNGDLVAYDFGG
jgi:hypothetical protein